MDTSKEEIVNLRKQINRLKISLMFTQVLMIALLLILGYQCLWSIWNYSLKLLYILVVILSRTAAVIASDIMESELVSEEIILGVYN